LKALEQQVQETSADYAKAKTEHPTLMSKFDADRTFQYLFRRSFGTSEYKGNPVTAKIDAWLAEKIDFLNAANIYQSAVTLDKKMADFLTAYDAKRTSLHNQLAEAEQKVQHELDDDRLEFSNVVNTLQEIDKSLKATYQTMDASKDLLKAIISAEDTDFRSMNEQLIKMLAREKAAAAVRLSKQNSPVVIIERNKALALGQDRLTVSIEADGMRRLAKAQVNRLVVIDELLRRLTARQWLSNDSYFDLDERSNFFIDISFREASVENAWPLLQQAYLPADAVLAMEGQPAAFNA
jgi:regulator of replication initiation timing